MRIFIFFIILIKSTLLNAAFINNSDIQTLSISSPKAWTVINTDQLFDGISERYEKTRFVARQNTGEKLSLDNIFSVDVILLDQIAVNKLAFFNDWRHHLNQQVKSLNLSLYGDANGLQNTLLWSQQFKNLKQDSWEEISLAAFDSPISGVKRVKYDITGSMGNHFEIRELLIGFENSPALASLRSISSTPVSAPSIMLIFSVLLSGLGFIRLFRSRRLKS